MSATPRSRFDPTPRVRGRRLQVSLKLWFAQHPLCKRCMDKDPPQLTVATQRDHIVPLAKGGQDEPDNWQSICDECHKDKTAQDFGWKRQQRIGLDGFPVEDAP